MKTPERGGTGRGERALRAAFARAFGGRAPAGIARAPGRINLIGEHTDYNGLPVLPFALPRAIRIAFAPRGDAAIVLRHGREGHPPREFTASPAIEPDPPGSWANYVKAAVEHFARLLLETPGASVRGFDAAVDGDIPQAGGLSSSSALVVAAALTFREVNALSMAPLEFAARCAAAERYVGTQGGGMDQAASILGAPGCALRIDFFPLAAAPVPFPEGYAVLACHSLVRAAKTEAARAEFNRRVGECRAAAALLGRAFDRPELPRLGDFAREFGTEACLRALGEAVPRTPRSSRGRGTCSRRPSASSRRRAPWRRATCPPWDASCPRRTQARAISTRSAPPPWRNSSGFSSRAAPSARASPAPASAASPSRSARRTRSPVSWP